jgi:hypothetical protein
VTSCHVPAVWCCREWCVAGRDALGGEAFLGRCGVLEGVLRRVAWNEERERSWTQQ